MATRLMTTQADGDAGEPDERVSPFAIGAMIDA